MRVKRQLLQNILLCSAALGMAWGLKYHYSVAHAQNLKWILSPTAAMVKWIMGNSFYFQVDTGYINHDLRIIIAPACAGVNFLITAFGMSAFCGIFRLTGFSTQCFWLAGSAVGAYAATISVNAVRIWISIATISADIHTAWFTPQRVHRMSGIVIYFFFLSVFYHIIQNIIDHIQVRKHAQKQKSEKHTSTPAGIVPLVFYWSIAIGIPCLNLAYKKDPAGFMEHSLTVGLLSFIMFAVFFLARAITAQIKIKRKKKPAFIDTVLK